MPVDDRRNWPIFDQREALIHHRTTAVVWLALSLADGPLNKRRFKQKIESILTGPFSTWIRHIVYSLNDVLPEDAEQDSLDYIGGEIEYEFAAWFLHPIDGSFDRTKAALEALDNLRKDEVHNRRTAIGLLKEEQHEARTTGPLPRGKVEEFFDWVKAVMDRVKTNQEYWTLIFRQRAEKRHHPKPVQGSAGSRRKKP